MLSPTLCHPINCSIPGLPALHYLLSFLKFMSIESKMPSNHLILCCPLLLLPSVFSSIGIFSSELGLCTRWPKYWSFSFSISPSNEYSGLISFKIDCFDLLAVQRTLKSLLQHQNSKDQKIISSLFSLLYGPTLTPVHYWKDYSFEKMKLMNTCAKLLCSN